MGSQLILSVSLQSDFYYLAGDSFQYICFGQFTIYFSASYSDLDTKHYTGVVLDMVLNIVFQY